MHIPLVSPSSTPGNLRGNRTVLVFFSRGGGKLFSFGKDFAGPLGHTHGICCSLGQRYIAPDQSFFPLGKGYLSLILSPLPRKTIPWGYPGGRPKGKQVISALFKRRTEFKETDIEYWEEFSLLVYYHLTIWEIWETNSTDVVSRKLISAMTLRKMIPKKTIAGAHK